ncbi:MAG: DegV family EDD domain-containing protein [Bacteroidales bacterium]|nr:DegV family EDD domain-containing protein [Bacteroidales bacterium]
METLQLDGKKFYYSFMAGAQKVFMHYALINKLNVFPVPDGDTGTNLASTLRSAMESFVPSHDIKSTAVALADAALVGARGNSGIIFAQFLYGFSNEIPTGGTLTVSSFAEVVNRSVRYAYEAITNPVEGTMITVIREWAEFIYSLRDQLEDFNQLIIASYHRAAEALADTPKKLELLARANVVDAGGKGFVVFLEGMVDFFRHGRIRSLVEMRRSMKLPVYTPPPHSGKYDGFRYCTEALVSFDHPAPDNRRKLTDMVSGFGNSMVIAGSPAKLRIHIHTNDPSGMMSAIRPLGCILHQKVDDMLLQNRVVHHRNWDIALVTDSTCDLPEEITDRYQIHVVPLSVHFGQEGYLDNVTLTPERFYEMLKESSIHPTTSQPGYRDFLNKYQFLSSFYGSVIGLHISDQMSGTCSTSRKAAGETAVPSAVFSSHSAGCGLGLMVLRAAREIEGGAAYGDLVGRIPGWVERSYLSFGTRTLKYLIRGGRVGAVRGRIGQLFGIQPLLRMSEAGRIELWKKPRSAAESMKMMLDEAIRILQSGELWGYAISHAQAKGTAEQLAAQLEQLTGRPPMFIRSASPVLGTHTGPGVVGLGILLE